MLPLEQTLFGGTQYAWVWYSYGLALLSFLMTAVIVLYIAYSAQQANLRAPFWIIISLLAWLLTVAAFLLTIDALAFPNRPFAFRLLPNAPEAQTTLRNPINLFAMLSMGGSILGLLSLGGYLARIGVTEEISGGWPMETKTTFIQESETVGTAQMGIDNEPGITSIGPTVEPTQAPGAQPAPTLVGTDASGTDLEKTIIRNPDSLEPTGGQEPSRTVVMRRPPREMAWLVQITGLHTGRVFRLGRVTEIGRDPGLNQIVVDDPEASGLHAIIRLIDGKFVLQDRGSANGTFVNGEEVLKHTLTDHDLIKIGQTEFVYLEVKAP